MSALAMFALALLAPPAWAQPNEALRLVKPAEEAELRRVLAQPVPRNATLDELRRVLDARNEAARRLGDHAARRAIVAEAVQRLPEARWPAQMGSLLRAEGRWDEARRQYELALERAQGSAERAFYGATLIEHLVERHAAGAADKVAAARVEAEALLAAGPTHAERVLLLRALVALELAEAQRLAWRGRLVEQVDAAERARQRAAAALALLEAEAAPRPSALRPAAGDLGRAQKRLAGALRQLERDAEAEAVLLEHLKTIEKHPVGADFAAGAHHALALLRMGQRDHAAAARQLRLALAVLDRVGVPPGATVYTDKLSDLALALWAQGRGEEALAELAVLERHLANANAPALRYAFERGLLHLALGDAAKAEPLLAEAARQRLRDWGAGHFYTALSQGLHGAALWRRGGPSGREQGAEQLKQAVLDLHAPRNIGELTDRGLRRPLRELLYRANVEAMTARGGLHALWAMGIADHLRGGITAQAMADAALRAAAADPELADLVRQEQDARRELQAAEEALRSSEGAAATPEAAAALRARIAELEAARQRVQQRTRERFPGYDRLVRPPLPDPAEVAQRLKRGEAFVMLMPGARELRSWIVTPDELPRFATQPVSAQELARLVARVRAPLGFAGGKRPAPFDRAAAQALYRHLLAPHEALLAKSSQLVISASGALATLPFAALVTGAQADAPWLVRRHAITQVPSVAAWLALRQSPRGQPAPEPLLAWGDPQFAGARGRTRGAPETGAERAGKVPAGGALRYADLPPLPETRDELLAIAAALKADVQRDLRLSAAATRESVLQASRSGELARKRVVVFATHGLMAGDLPGLAQPALALSATGSDWRAHLVTLEDVLGLKLNADWVVLSACNTASADGRAEEALSGLARGFFYAGSRSLLVTQWEVETESARLLTSATFAHHAREREASKSESLRQAMLQVMAMPQYAHPAYWAPYMLVGDGAR